MKTVVKRILLLWSLLFFANTAGFAQSGHPRIYISEAEETSFRNRLETSEKASAMVKQLELKLEPYITRHQSDPEWIVSRLQMYWKTKYTHVYVKGMDFSHGEGTASVPTVRFSGSRDWATDYLVPDIQDIQPYMDDERGLYLQNGAKEGRPWEWTPPSETGHVIEKINRKILDLARDAAFLYWLRQEEQYAIFASDIFMTYMEGMYHREPPQTVGNHHNAKLMGLQTFEVIHEGILEPITICYDFLYSYLVKTGQDLDMITAVLKKWVEQEIKFGVPDNNWNLMQARYITYLALALESDDQYADGKGQEYYLDQMLNQNSEKQKALVDVLKTFDQKTGIWPETAGYSTGVSEDILEVICLIDRAHNNRMLEEYPLVEKAILTTFQYLFPNGFTVAFGDAKHSRLRFNALELLIAQYRKYGQKEKEDLITAQLKKFIDDGAYDRSEVHSLFDLFMYVDELAEVAPASGLADLVTPVFYAPNVSWLVQRNGMETENPLMVSTNASLGNHSHTNGINVELFAKGMVIAPDCAAGISYWSEDHRDYYSRFAAHNTVVVDGRSDYRNMRGRQAFTLQACYPTSEVKSSFESPYTFSDVTFLEPSTNARQRRLTATFRVGEKGGYFLDIFRSAREDGEDKKHEYLFRSQGEAITLSNPEGHSIVTEVTDELSSAKGDLVGYDYFREKRMAVLEDDFVAHFKMPGNSGSQLQVNLWMRGYPERKIFTVMAPYSRAISSKSVPESLYKKPLPTLAVRQKGEACTRPFISVIEAFDEEEGSVIKQVDHLMPKETNTGFVGVKVHAASGQIDHIFNDTHGEKENVIGRHKFKGTFGIVSYQGGQLHTLFLGAGTLLESGPWSLRSEEMDNAVLLQKTEDGFQLNAQKKFRLIMPASKAKRKKAILKVTGKTGKRKYKGTVSFQNNQTVAIFDLPAMENVQLKIR